MTNPQSGEERAETAETTPSFLPSELGFLGTIENLLINCIGGLDEDDVMSRRIGRVIDVISERAEKLAKQESLPKCSAPEMGGKENQNAESETSLLLGVEQGKEDLGVQGDHPVSGNFPDRRNLTNDQRLTLTAESVTGEGAKAAINSMRDQGFSKLYWGPVESRLLELEREIRSLRSDANVATITYEGMRAERDRYKAALERVRETSALIAEGEGDKEWVYQQMGKHMLGIIDAALMPEEKR